MFTLKPGILSVATAYPDPPFDVLLPDEKGGGFDVELMRAIAKELNLTLHEVHYEGENFNGIFDGLENQQYDAVISGTTITPERAMRVLFSVPYLEFNQGVAVNRRVSPAIKTLTDLKGLIAGIQKGNTSDAVAKKLLADGVLADVHYYAYRQMPQALEDLNAGRIGLIIKLFPVISSFVKGYPDLHVPLQVPTAEKIGIAFHKNNHALCEAVNQAIMRLQQDGTFAQISQRWFGEFL